MRGAGSVVVGVLALIGAMVLASTVLGFLMHSVAFLLGWINTLVLIGVAIFAGAGTYSAIQRGRLQLAAMAGNVAVLAAWGAWHGWSLVGTTILVAICLAAQLFVARAMRAAV